MPVVAIIVGIGVGLTALGIFGAALYRCLRPGPNAGGPIGAPVHQPPLYEALRANAALVPTAQQLANWVNSPGGTTINARVLGVLNHVNVLAYSNHLHTTLGNHNFWAWNPIACMFTGDALLDGVETSGECRIPAEALATLLSARVPFGFAHPAAGFAVLTYAGANGHGFIATHTNTVLGLESNTWRSNGAAVGFYNWMNHKTLRYTDPLGVTRYYDPSYATSQAGAGFYANQPAMAVAQLAGTIVFNAAVFGGKHIFGVMKTDDTNNVHRGFYIACARDPANGNLATTVQFNANPDTYKVAYVGPFNTNVSDAAHDFNFDITNDYLNGINNLA